MDRFAGIDIGGTTIQIGIISRDGTKIAEDQIPANVHRGVDPVLDDIVATLRKHVKKNGDDIAFKAVGIGIPGEVNEDRGILTKSVNLPGWDNMPLADLLQSRMGCPIFMDNDANVAVLGEHTFGAGRGVTELMMVTLGTGVGGGLILRGEIYRGADNVTGEIGHMIIQADGLKCNCGRRGCLEAFVCAGAIVRTVLVKLDQGMSSSLATVNRSEITAKRIAEAALEGDNLARSIYETAGRYLGIGLGNVNNLMNLQRIVIGGGVAQAGELLLAPARESLRETALTIPGASVELVTSVLGHSAGMMGAAWMAVLQSK